MGGTTLLTSETIEQFEKMIYLPMLLTILDRDTKVFEQLSVKFKEPYLSLIKRATEIVQSDLTSTHLYFKEHKMKLVNEGKDGDFTSYLFIIGSEQYRRRYMNFRLRNHSEELLKIYLDRQN